jgi:predicted dinucleotide-binding enzyme
MSQVINCCRFRPICLRLLLFVFGLAGPVSGSADTIAIIGTGDVAQALGPEFASLGHRIVYGSRDPAQARIGDLIEKTGQGTTVLRPDEAVVGADIVVLAVPGMVVENVNPGVGVMSG